MKFNNPTISIPVVVFDVTIACMENATHRIQFMEYSLFPVDINDLYSQVSKMFPLSGDYSFLGITFISTREEIYEIPLSDFVDVASPQ